MKQLFKIRIASGLEYEAIGDCELQLKQDDTVIVQCERYLDYAVICQPGGDLIEDEDELERQRAMLNKGRHIEGQKLPGILRRATEQDVEQARINDRDAFEAHNMTVERIRAHNLEMKLIQTHYAFDRKLLIFQFSADGRVDFRELLRDLSGLFKARIELRQVGVRDEASILGGVGTCGRPFCCTNFLKSFNSINVKMAKQQGLSLNPQNISGCCGRLKCCLQFEAEIYKEINAESQKAEEAASSGTESAAEAPEEAPERQMAPASAATPKHGGRNIGGNAQPGGFNGHSQQRGNRRNDSGIDNHDGGNQNGNPQVRNNPRNPNRQPFNPRNPNANAPQNGNDANRQQRMHKNPPKRPMPPPDKQVKHPLPPADNPSSRQESAPNSQE